MVELIKQAVNKFNNEMDNLVYYGVAIHNLPPPKAGKGNYLLHHAIDLNIIYFEGRKFRETEKSRNFAD